MRSTTKTKQLIAQINHKFIFVDLCLSGLCVLGIFITIRQPCSSALLALYSLFFGIQSTQHVLIHRFPGIDINRHHVAYRRVIIGICMVDLAYLMMIITFWERN